MQMPDDAVQCTLLKVRAGGGPGLESSLGDFPSFQVAGTYDHAVFRKLSSTDVDTSFLTSKGQDSLQFDQILNILLLPMDDGGGSCLEWLEEAVRESRVVLMVFMSAHHSAVLLARDRVVEDAILDYLMSAGGQLGIDRENYRLCLTLGHPGVFAFLRTEGNGQGLRQLLKTAADLRTLLTDSGTPLLHKTLTTILIPQSDRGSNNETEWVDDESDRLGAVVQVSGSAGMNPGSIKDIGEAITKLQSHKDTAEGSPPRKINQQATLDAVFGSVDALFRVPDIAGEAIAFPLLMAAIKRIRDNEGKDIFDYYHTATVPILARSATDFPIAPAPQGDLPPIVKTFSQKVDAYRKELLRAKAIVNKPQHLKSVVDMFIDRFASYVQPTTGHAFLDMFPFAANFKSILINGAKQAINPDDNASLYDIIVNANFALEQRYETLERHLAGAPYTPTTWTLGLTKALEAIGALPSFLIANLPSEPPDGNKQQNRAQWGGFVVVGQGSQFRWVRPEAMAVPASALACPITSWTALGHETAHIMYVKWNVSKEIQNAIEATKDDLSSRMDWFAPLGYFEEVAEEIFAYLFDYYYCYGGTEVARFPTFLHSVWKALSNITDIRSPRKQEYFLFKLFCAYLGALAQGNELWRSQGVRRLALLSRDFDDMLKLLGGFCVEVQDERKRALVFRSASFVGLIETIKSRYMLQRAQVALQRPYDALQEHVRLIKDGQVVTGISNPLRLLYDLHKEWIAPQGEFGSEVPMKSNLALLFSLAHYQRRYLIDTIGE